MNKKLLLVGYGFVGKAYYTAFSPYYDIVIVDPLYTDTKIEDNLEVDGIIVCVPTPQSSSGRCDMQHVLKVLSSITTRVPIMIKSTISLEGWEEIKSKFSHLNITFSPEFLRAATAVEDVLATKNVIISGDSLDFWESVYKKVFSSCQVYKLKPEEAILVKYFRNSFLATKVSYFNQVFDMCKVLGLDYRYVREAISLDDRIGSSHTLVFEDSRGFGGYCFPKDTAAILSTAQDFNIDLSIIRSAVEYNNKIQEKND